MWVNREFVKNMENMLGCLLSGDFAYDLTNFEKFKSKKYERIIENLKNLQSDFHKISSFLGSFSTGGYATSLKLRDGKNDLALVLEKIGYNMKNLTDDLSEMTQSVSALDFKTVLPLRDDHQQLRKSANRMIRNLEEHDNQLKGLLEDSRQQIKNLKEDISKRLTYLRELSLFAVKIAKGDFSGHVPWTDSERFLAESLRQVQTQHQLACDILSALSKGDLTPEYSLNDEKDLLGKSLNSCLQAARDKETLLENTRNNYTELQNRHEETNLYINNITNYIRGLANGDYSLKEPQHENGKELFEALHQLKQNTKEISSIVLKAAAGDFQQEIPLRHQNDLLGSSLLQLFQSFDRYSTSFKNKISELSQKSADLQNQQSELLDYNIKFEGKYEDLVTQYESSIQQQKELSVDNDRLKRRNSVLEAENRDISRKYATVTKQFKSVEQKNEKLIRSNERNLKFISKFFPELKKSVQKYHKLVKNHENLLKIDSEKTLLKKMSTIQTEVENTLKFIAGASADFFSKAEPTALEITEIDLGKFLNKLDQQFKEIAVDKSITLSFNMEKTASLKISTDEIRFEQILNTLLTTALKTTEASAVQCRIFRAEDRKPQNEEQPRGTIGFEISTDAAGGPVNGHEIVFEAFQGIYAVKDSHSGETDLGLAMLRDLALLLKGEIHLHSIQGKGNTYLLLLPATFHPPEDSTEEKTAPQINIQEKTLLILEEDTAFITSFSQTARQRQYQCVVGNSADEALELLKKYSPCGVLLGMKWADEKGAKLIDQILSASYPHRIPFYAVSNIKVEVDGWRETMVGSLGKSPVPADITNALDRMESFYSAPRLNILVVTLENEPSGKLKELALEYDANTVFSPLEDLQSLLTDHFNLVLLNFESPGSPFEELSAKIADCVRIVPDCPLIIYTKDKPAYQFQKFYDQTLDVSFWGETAFNDNYLAEAICLSAGIRELDPAERRKRFTGYLRDRDRILTGKQLLMVADNVPDTLALRKQLNLRGIEIRVNSQGKNIIEVLEGHSHCDLILMDLSTPDSKTTQAIGKIREKNGLDHIPMILMNSQTRYGDYEYWKTSGVEEHLTKPVDFQKLLSAIRVQLELKNPSLA